MHFVIGHNELQRPVTYIYIHNIMCLDKHGNWGVPQKNGDIGGTSNVFFPFQVSTLRI